MPFLIANYQKRSYNIRRGDTMTFDKAFKKQPRLIQILLLLIPVVNWVTEILVRTSALIHQRNLKTVIGFVLGLFLGFAFGWVDLIWCLLFKHLIFQ